jgi:hypothetical protein
LSLALREEHKMKVYKNRVPKGIFKLKREEIQEHGRTA